MKRDPVLWDLTHSQGDGATFFAHTKAEKCPHVLGDLSLLKREVMEIW